MGTGVSLNRLLEIGILYQSWEIHTPFTLPGPLSNQQYANTPSQINLLKLELSHTYHLHSTHKSPMSDDGSTFLADTCSLPASPIQSVNPGREFKRNLSFYNRLGVKEYLEGSRYQRRTTMLETKPSEEEKVSLSMTGHSFVSPTEQVLTFQQQHLVLKMLKKLLEHDIFDHSRDYVEKVNERPGGSEILDHLRMHLPSAQSNQVILERCGAEKASPDEHPNTLSLTEVKNQVKKRHMFSGAVTVCEICSQAIFCVSLVPRGSNRNGLVLIIERSQYWS